ncbi:MAG: hypothetical protein JWM32_2169 [Verrucomicrobia bacterium]|nr:hypothetical protein [Verrucomicrobiota bacterium]
MAVLQEAPPPAPTPLAVAAPPSAVVSENPILSLVDPLTTAAAARATEMKAIAAAAIIAVILGFIVWYQTSATGIMRRKLRALGRSFDELEARIQEQILSMRTAARQAGEAYIAAMRKRYLQSVSLDDIRKLAPGARMQPLRDMGIMNLLACQGWSAPQFERLRGIGPDSATRLAAACSSLTKSAYRQPIPHPVLDDTDAAGKQLFARIFLQHINHETLKPARAALEAASGAFKSEWIQIRDQTGFLTWIFKSQTRDPLRAAIEHAQRLQSRMATGSDWGLAFSQATARLTEALALVRLPISPSNLSAHVIAQSGKYQAAFDELLGPSLMGASVPPNISMPAEEPIHVQSTAAPARTYQITGRPSFKIDVSLSQSSVQQAPTFSATSAECWIPMGRTTSVGGFKLTGGLLYVGQDLGAIHGRSLEPALIDPELPLNLAAANPRQRMLNYWSNYSEAEPTARASYLQWIADGKADPAADVGYVFLYFYGLERRALSDPTNDPSAVSDREHIIAEVKRLRAIFATNRSFNKYSGDFLNYVETLHAIDSGFDSTAAPPAVERYQLSFELRRKLGKFAVDGEPLPANWAYAWYYSDPRTRLLAAAERCPDHFKSLFTHEYQRRYGEGLLLPANKTRLKITYRAASASFGEFLAQAVDLPDVSVLTASYAKLDEVATACFEQLDGYSRFVARNRDQPDSWESRLLLPPVLWPESLRTELETFMRSSRQSGIPATHPLRSLMAIFEHTLAPTRAQYVALAQALGTLKIGIEPSLQFTKEVPGIDDPIALFPVEGTPELGRGFGFASLLLQLASAVASADRDFSEPEIRRLQEELQKTPEVEPAGRQRLLARMAVNRLKSPSTNGLKAAIAPLSAGIRAQVADFLLTVVYADGLVDPAEVRIMEKIYTLLALDSSMLYSRLHGLAAIPTTTPSPAPAQRSGPLKLDMEKVARLRASSDQVSQRVAAIYVEDTPAVVEQPKEFAAANRPDSPPLGLLGLDSAHAELLAVVLGRAQWTRGEFEEICTDKGLMTDGAIERINDAAFTQYNQPLIEGEDPLDVGVHLLKETAA